MLDIKFETERLSIDPLSLEHTNFMFDLLRTQGWKKNIGDRGINTKDDAYAYINKILNSSNYTYLVYSLKENNDPLGIVTLIKRDYMEDYDIGFAILPKYKKNGYTYEASAQFLHLISSKNICKTVVAIILPENAPSISLIKKLGLKYVKDITHEDKIQSIFQISF